MTTAFADALGPRGRRRVAIATTGSALVVLAIVAEAARRLSSRGFFDAEKWSYFTNPSVVRFLAEGAWATVRVAVVAMVLAMAVGAVLALGRRSRNRPLRWTAGVWVEGFRALPLVLLILYAGRALPQQGLRVGAFWYLVLGLVAYNSAVLAEIFRSGLASLPRGQAEAAASLGLGPARTMVHVLAPQALRRMLPALVSQLVTLLKDTSLGFVLPFEELLRRGQIAGEEGRNLLQALVVVAVAYLLINGLLSALANRLARRPVRAA